MVEWVEYAKFFAELLSIVNPIGSIPVFINLTANQAPAERNRTGLLAFLSVVLVLGIVLVAGEALLRFFGITVSSFRVGGGILILLMAISMMNAKLSPVKQTEEEARDADETVQSANCKIFTFTLSLYILHFALCNLNFALCNSVFILWL